MLPYRKPGYFIWQKKEVTKVWILDFLCVSIAGI